jgi:hypothetical protein
MLEVDASGHGPFGYRFAMKQEGCSEGCDTVKFCLP